jgi:hypothetical protein
MLAVALPAGQPPSGVGASLNAGGHGDVDGHRAGRELDLLVNPGPRVSSLERVWGVWLPPDSDPIGENVS